MTSWWYKVPPHHRRRRREEHLNQPDQLMNRIEQARLDADRKDLTLIVEAHPFSTSFHSHTTETLENDHVRLIETGTAIDRRTIFLNGEYYWVNTLPAPASVDDMAEFN